MQSKWEDIYEGKRVTLEKALQAVKRGAKVFIGTACAEPQFLFNGLIENASNLRGVELLHFVTLGKKPYSEKRFDSRFRHNAFFVGPNSRDAINQARADYTPVFISEIPDLFRRRIVSLDVALVQTSYPDTHGFVSLGISVDIVKAAVESSKVVIAQVNRHMPRTLGETFIHLSELDFIVEHDDRLVEFEYPEPDEVGMKIVENASKLINDGDTIHAGFGHLPYGVLSRLKGKRNLGIHTEVMSDAIIDLIECGAVTGKYKSINPGKVVCSFCIGTERTYEYVNDNPRIAFFPAEYVYNPIIIAGNDRMVSIGSALEVDLSGQICSESKGFHFYSGIGGRLDFIRGAAMSRGGKSIITLPSSTKDGTQSRIMPHLQEGSSVVATRGDVHYVVTEYGIAYLHGRSIRERAMALINIAHPKFRKELLEEAKRRAYVYPDQIFIHTKTHPYPEEEETSVKLIDHTKVTIRPVKPTDEPLLQDFFYSHSDETIYRRYFRSVRAMPHATAQTLVNVDYKDTMALVATLGAIGFERIIGVGRYGAETDRPGMVEVAFTVHEDYQSKGLGAILVKRLEDYACRKGFKGVSGYLFQDNTAMLKIFAKQGPYHGEDFEDGILRVWHMFDEREKADKTRKARKEPTPK